MDNITEKQNSKSEKLNQLNSLNILNLINDEDSKITSSIKKNIPKINQKILENYSIEKSEINKSLNYNSLTYEGFGPEKIAIIIEALTDNKNRTASNIRTLFQKFGGVTPAYEDTVK